MTFIDTIYASNIVITYVIPLNSGRNSWFRDKMAYKVQIWEEICDTKKTGGWRLPKLTQPGGGVVFEN